ncbi:50S ribosomal protein L4 [Entomospira culicis]|uniref:Large ribosomal subunit protein uL4 n=1 Tax=Entomospira culicis TaxID=2719989 RepID=A0A968GJ01_9SPIO|nr:50S ribosomal protein L4 [Entomospira culicis]NIZ19718.1 50S ribosomal protein L4 [Entomospira culicis]NIZ69932.1 50S ribosomal protein L4 [Entomospira culicis]WDI37037.1 50S ribosomal protein L4 [Entomospira culicis]WDI38666.1 50S ribosomal protein L4 [Entomospira culicis]
MDKKVYSIDGKEKGKVILSDEVFAIEVSEGSIYHAIRNEAANRRVGTASTKTRSEVNTNHQKPYRQKGTGRARAGRRNSPVWVGGGTAFGPKPRDYSYSLPKKVKRLALKSILAMKASDDDVFKVVEDFTIASGKTKDLRVILHHFFTHERAVVIMKDDDMMLRRAGRNFPNVRFLAYNRLEAHELFYAKKVLILETATQELGKFYGER